MIRLLHALNFREADGTDSSQKTLIEARYVLRFKYYSREKQSRFGKGKHTFPCLDCVLNSKYNTPPAAALARKRTTSTKTGWFEYSRNFRLILRKIRTSDLCRQFVNFAQLSVSPYHGIPRLAYLRNLRITSFDGRLWARYEKRLNSALSEIIRNISIMSIVVEQLAISVPHTISTLKGWTARIIRFDS